MKDKSMSKPDTYLIAAAAVFFMSLVVYDQVRTAQMDNAHQHSINYPVKA